MKEIKIGCISPIFVTIFLAFFFAKIFNLVTWSWWIVFSPLWVPPLVCLILIISIMILKIWLK